MAPAVERPRDHRRAQRGQATVELIAALPALGLAAALAFQLLVVGVTLTLADGAAEAGALALASGGRAVPAAQEALPGWARDGASVSVEGGRITVEVEPPSPLRLLSEEAAVRSSAWARRPR